MKSIFFLSLKKAKREMDINSTIKKINEEIKGEKRKETIDSLEEVLIQNIEEIQNFEGFFQLPLTNILSIISKVDFTLISDKINVLKLLQNFVQNSIQAHFEEKETILLLQNIDISNIQLSFEEILSILEKFTNCPFLSQICDLYKENKQLPEKDYEYEIKQKDQEIQKLKLQIKNSETKIYFQPISEKPKDFESNIFKASKEGKLTSVQWLIEKENVDQNKTYTNDKPIHVASMNGHLPIAEYFISKGANINAKDRDR